MEDLFWEKVMINKIEDGLSGIGIREEEKGNVMVSYGVFNAYSMGDLPLWDTKGGLIFLEAGLLDYAKKWKEYNEIKWDEKPQKREDVLREKCGTMKS